MFRKQYIIPLLALMCIIALLFKGPIQQDLNYHNFADKRKLWSIPNFLNVVTNLPFAIVAVLGFSVAKKIRENGLQRIISTLFVGFLLVTFGSGYYHLWPSNATLVFDRIPIVIILMSFFAYIIYYCIDKRTGSKAFIIFNFGGIVSVIYWAFSESMGKGDLRWYGMVQFFPVIAIPLTLILYKASFNNWKELILIFIFFGIARLCEMFDKETYDILSRTISGHSLKHLFMSAAGLAIVIMIRRQNGKQNKQY